MRIAPSGYWRHAAQQRDLSRVPARAQRDAMLIPEIQRVWHANRQVYGADKVGRQLRREGVEVVRCTVERLMRRLGLKGVRRGKPVKTTVSNPKAACPEDRVNRPFTAEHPNAPWVSDFSVPQQAA